MRAAALFVALLACALAGAQEVAPDLQLHVRTRNAALRAEPNLGAALVDALDYGTALRQRNLRGNWYEVEDPATGTRGWIHRDDASLQSPVLEAGYGALRWGQSVQEVQQAVPGVRLENGRLVESREQGPIEAVAYNFRNERLWFVEERFRLSGADLDRVLQRARERFGKPHAEGSQRWSDKPEEVSPSEVLMEMRFFRWNTGVTSLALVSYGPLYEEGDSEIRAEYWSTAVAAEEGLSREDEVLEGLEFGGAAP